tara:strand:+ start:159 stop:641 length:483 start_codon:yes stop_codon:yes gene_type:complete
MRKFKFKGVSKQYGWDILPIHDDVYNESEIASMYGEGWNYINFFGTMDEDEDWEEVFEEPMKKSITPKEVIEEYRKTGRILPEENKVSDHFHDALFDWTRKAINRQPLHKDTDLGYYAGLAMQGLIANAPNGHLSNFKEGCSLAIGWAKELIKQLDKEAK